MFIIEGVLEVYLNPLWGLLTYTFSNKFHIISFIYLNVNGALAHWLGCVWVPTHI